MEKFSNEKLPEPVIVGKDLDDTNLKIAQAAIKRRYKKGEEPIEDELEKTEDEKKIIAAIPDLVIQEIEDLGFLTDQKLEEEQVHIFDKKDQKNPDKGNFGQHNAVRASIKIKRGEKTFKEKLKNVWDKIPPNTESLYEINRFTFLKVLLHETIHKFGHTKFHANKEQEKIFNYRTGYKIKNTFTDNQQDRFTGLNEGVVERLTQELLEKNIEHIKKDLQINQKEIEKGGHFSYQMEVRLVKLLTKAISEKLNLPEKEIWEQFKKGYFTGEMMHLRIIEEIYGEGSLRILSLHNPKDKSKEKAELIWGYFNTKDNNKKTEIQKELLKNSNTE